MDSQVLERTASSPSQNAPNESRESDAELSPFVSRHIGPNDDEIAAMLQAIGFDDLDSFIDATVPKDIRLRQPLDLPEGKPTQEALAELRAIAQKNRVMRNFIGAGYSDCVVPSVIQRNVLENPGWYTAYTPYQAE